MVDYGARPFASFFSKVIESIEIADLWAQSGER